jgi:hypothetical protein
MRLRIWVLVTLMALPCFCRGAERITLRNGFAMKCDHHAQVSDHTRLYLGRDEGSFIEFLSQEVAEVEVLPDEQIPVRVQAKQVVGATAGAQLSQADLHQMLTRAGEEHNVDADLLASVVKAESGGNPKALSRAGAKGLMQLMPATANQLGVGDSYKPDQNVRGGTTYLDSLLARYNDNLALALAAYNAGPEAVAKYHGIPPYHETRVYVARVIHEFNRRVREREAALRSAKSN